MEIKPATSGNQSIQTLLISLTPLIDSVYRQAIPRAGAGCMAALDAEKYLDELVGLT